MRWYQYVAYFFGGASLRTRCPISAMASRLCFSESLRITTRGRLVLLDGQCPMGLFNLAIGYLLVCRVGSFNLRKNGHVLSSGPAS